LSTADLDGSGGKVVLETVRQRFGDMSTARVAVGQLVVTLPKNEGWNSYVERGKKQAPDGRSAPIRALSENRPLFQVRKVDA
jgi:hypothetical protein